MNARKNRALRPSRKPVIPDESWILDPETGCHIWTRARHPQGYGYFWFRGNLTRAHRYFYERHHGRVADGLLVRHLCDNPPCVNVDHLLVGTASDNSQDCLNRGRRPLGEAAHGAVLTEDEVRTFHELSLAGWRICDIARLFDRPQRLVWNTLNRKWRHVAAEFEGEQT